MQTGTKVALGLGAAGALLLILNASSSSFNYGGPDDTARGLSRDPKLLLPSFAKRLIPLFAAMRARGFDPMLWEGWRSRARAAALVAGGAQAIADSMHFYGAAADIVSASKLWSDPAFFRALGEEADRLGLYWGGHWKKPDSPHVQALSVASEPRFRLLAQAGGDLDHFVTAEMAA